jgi:hypothetical protein
VRSETSDSIPALDAQGCLQDGPMRRRKKLYLLNSSIDVPKQSELTPIKALLQAEVGIRPNARLSGCV